MLSNSLVDLLCTMSQSNNGQTRKKLGKQLATSARSSSHKLKKDSPSTSQATGTIEEEREIGKTSSSENAGVPLKSDAEVGQTGRRVEKTVSGVNLARRKLWNNNIRSTDYPPNGRIIKEESELIGALSKQLYLVEAQMQKLQAILKRNEDQLRSKDQEIGRLKRKVKDWEIKSKNQEILHKKEQQQRRQQSDHSEYFHRRCQMLEHRILEMERFLGDYGLVWVGDANEPSSPATPNSHIEACYGQIVANIDQLNLAAGKGEVHVHRDQKGGGATFKTPSCVSLKFYKNGLVVKNGGLRPYDQPEAMSFLRDILDGYFPSELQQAYPNGVPFKVEDRRSQMYTGNSGVFPGQGYRLGRQPPVDNTPLSTTARKPSETSQRSGRSPLPREIPSEFNSVLSSMARNDCPLRSSRSKCTSEAAPMEMYVLRSQILASHNNICSDTHLQSHINAELGLSSRREKRDVATRNVECDLSTRERILRGKTDSRFLSAGRCYHSSTDRSSKLSPTGLDRGRQRSRSASLPSTRLTSSRSTPRTKTSAEINHSGFMRVPYLGTTYDSSKERSATRSQGQTRNYEPPVLHQINEPSGKEGELRLKVRSLNGGIVYLVHVSADDSVARLYQLLDRAISRTVPRKYKIVLSGYSPRRLEQLGVSLRESGISRDSVLHLVND